VLELAQIPSATYLQHFLLNFLFVDMQCAGSFIPAIFFILKDFNPSLDFYNISDYL
jgi:hypothetical protein